MMEQPGDIEAQEKVARILEGKWHCVAERLSTYYPVDYALSKPGSLLIDALVEVKVRKDLERGSFETYMIGVHKVIRMIELSAFVPVFLVVQFKDWLAYWEARPITIPGGIPPPLYVGGRTDRKDRGRNDIEPTLRIPLYDFMEVKQCRTP